jgi:hypothetical protein
MLKNTSPFTSVMRFRDLRSGRGTLDQPLHDLLRAQATAAGENSRTRVATMESLDKRLFFQWESQQLRTALRAVMSAAPGAHDGPRMLEALEHFGGPVRRSARYQVFNRQYLVASMEVVAFYPSNLKTQYFTQAPSLEFLRQLGTLTRDQEYSLLTILNVQWMAAAEPRLIVPPDIVPSHEAQVQAFLWGRENGYRPRIMSSSTCAECQIDIYDIERQSESRTEFQISWASSGPNDTIPYDAIERFFSSHSPPDSHILTGVDF